MLAVHYCAAHCWPRHPDERFDGYSLLANLLANRWVTTVEVMATACCCCLLACLGTRICHGRCMPLLPWWSPRAGRSRWMSPGHK